MTPISTPISDTLFFGTSYIATPERQWLVDKWIKLHQRLNPFIEMLIVDSSSPLRIPEHARHVGVKSFPDNIGHLMSTGQDGWGRAFCEGLQCAIKYNFRYVAYVDTDILFARPVDRIFDQMQLGDIKYATVRGLPYPWMEGGIVFADVQWLKQMEFIERYAWEQMTSRIFPEQRLMDLAGSALYVLDIPGRRNDDGVITVDNAGTVDWLTHSSQAVYEAFLVAHGMGDLV